MSRQFKQSSRQIRNLVGFLQNDDVDQSKDQLNNHQQLTEKILLQKISLEKDNLEFFSKEINFDNKSSSAQTYLRNNQESGKIINDINSHREHPLSNLKAEGLIFGEKNFYQVYEDLNEDGEIILKNIDFSLTENINQFLGYETIISLDGKSKKLNDEMQDGGMDFGNNDENQELNSLQLYWRFDEGKGQSIEDLGNFQNNGVIEYIEQDQWIMLDDGDPLESEDKWGKKCPVQYSIAFEKSQQTLIRTHKKNWYNIEQFDQFTFEIWVKPKSENGVILSLGEDHFQLKIVDFEIRLSCFSQEIQLDLESQKEQQNEDVQDQEDYRKLKESIWNHLSIVYDNQQETKLKILINCIVCASSNFIFPNNLFKDSPLILGNGSFEGELTELRFWRESLSISEIKDQYRSPLEIVAEKRKQLKMKLKKTQKGDQNESKKFTTTLQRPGAFSKPKENQQSQLSLSFPTQFKQRPEKLQQVSNQAFQNAFESIIQKSPQKQKFSQGLTPSSIHRNFNFEEVKEVQPNEGSQKELQDLQGCKDNRDRIRSNSRNANKSNSSRNSIEKQNLNEENYQKRQFENQSEEKNEFESNADWSNFQNFDKRQESSFPKNEFQTNDFKSFAGFGQNFSTVNPQDQNQLKNDWANFGFGQSLTQSTQKDNSQIQSSFKNNQSQFDQWTSQAQKLQKTEKSDFGNFANFEDQLPQMKKNNSIQTPQRKSGNPSLEESKISEMLINSAKRKKIEQKSQAIKEVNSLMENAFENLNSHQYPQATQFINKSLQKLKIIHDNQHIERNSYFPQLLSCSNYLFALQLLMGIKEMEAKKDFKNENYLFMILLNLKSINADHIIVFYLDAISKNVNFKNYQTAENFINTLMTFKYKNPKFQLSRQQENVLEYCTQIIKAQQQKNDAVQTSRVCPNCGKRFLFKGILKCQLCNQEFLLCHQTLELLSKAKSLFCLICEAKFSTKVKKENERCPICRISPLKHFS